MSTSRTHDSGAIVIETASVEETRAIGARLAGRLEAGDCVALSGELGTGKTQLTKGIAQGLGIAPDEVASPTFVLHAMYEGRLTLHHLDAYRMKSAFEMNDLGLADYLDAGGVAVIEWADRVSEALPENRVDVTLEHAGDDRRRITIRPSGSFKLNEGGIL